MAGLLDAFVQYIRDAMPGGVLNSEFNQSNANRIVDDTQRGLLESSGINARDKRRAWNKGLLDAVSGSDDTMSSINQKAFDSVMNLSSIAPAGMIRTPRGAIPETRRDVNLLSDRLARLLDDSGIPYTQSKSQISPARYFKIENPQAKIDDSAPGIFDARISDHRNVHGSDFSVDPVSQNTFEDLIATIQRIGVPIETRVKPTKKTIVDDATLARIWGGDISTAPPGWVDQMRENLVFSPKGYWVNKLEQR